MEDMLLMQFLKKKGVISERDIHEFHELASASMESEPVYLAKTEEVMTHQSDTHMSEIEAREVVSGMYHIEGGRKYIGEKFDMYKAKEVCERYRGLIPTSTTVCDVYVAINSQYHDYAELFKSWFGDGIEQKIVESAIMFWFKDADCKAENKVVKYFKEY